MQRRKPGRAQQYRSRAYKELVARLATNIRRLREAHEWSQEEAAHRCKMATRLFQKAEAGEINMTLTTLARLCEGFEVDIVDLVG